MYFWRRLKVLQFQWIDSLKKRLLEKYINFFEIFIAILINQVFIWLKIRAAT